MRLPVAIFGEAVATPYSGFVGDLAGAATGEGEVGGRGGGQIEDDGFEQLVGQLGEGRGVHDEGLQSAAGDQPDW